MSYKPNESDLIAYLYGELSNDQKRLVEDYLANSSEAREELEQLKETRLMLGKLSDKEVIEPVIEFEQSTPHRLVIKAERRILRPLLAIAATIILLMVVGYATNTTVSFANSELKIAFGSSGNGAGNTDTIEKYIDDRIAETESKLNSDLNSKFVNLREDLGNELLTEQENQLVMLKQTLSNGSTLQQAELRNLAKQLQEDNLKALADFVAASGENHQEYVNQLLVSFSTFFEEQRIDDLRTIEQTLQTLKEDTDLKYEQTGQILASIVSTVNDNID